MNFKDIVPHISSRPRASLSGLSSGVRLSIQAAFVMVIGLTPSCSNVQGNPSAKPFIGKSIKKAGVVHAGDIPSIEERQGIIEHVLTTLFSEIKFTDESADGKKTPLLFKQITPEHVASLLTLPDVSPGTFAPLFLVDQGKEGLLKPEIYQNQTVIVTLPSALQGKYASLLSLEDIVPRDIPAIEYRGRIYVRRIASDQIQSQYRNNNDLYR